MFRKRTRYVGVPGGNVSILEGHSISRRKQCLCTCHLFRDRAISPYDIDVLSTMYPRATRRALRRPTKCSDVGGTFENVSQTNKKTPWPLVR
jgi:hypothetical protein